MLHQKNVPIQEYKSSREKKRISITILKNNEMKGNGNKNVFQYGNDFKNCKIISDKNSN